MQADENGRRICGAKTRQGTPCQNSPMANGRCRMHGGNAARGAALPQFKHGRYSKYLPTNLADRYRMALTDKDLTSLRDEIALTDARLGEVLEGLNNSGNAELWQQVQRVCDALESAVQRGDATTTQSTLRDFRALVTAGTAQEGHWQTIARLIDQRRKLVESERRHQVERAQVLTLGQVFGLLGAVSALVKEHVADRDALQAIANGIADLAARHDTSAELAGVVVDAGRA